MEAGGVVWNLIIVIPACLVFLVIVKLVKWRAGICDLGFEYCNLNPSNIIFSPVSVLFIGHGEPHYQGKGQTRGSFSLHSQLAFSITSEFSFSYSMRTMRPI